MLRSARNSRNPTLGEGPFPPCGTVSPPPRGGGGCELVRRRDDAFGGVEPCVIVAPQHGDCPLSQVALGLEPRKLLAQDELEALGFLDHQPQRRRTKAAVLLHGSRALDEIGAALTHNAVPVQAHVSLLTP